MEDSPRTFFPAMEFLSRISEEYLSLPKLPSCYPNIKLFRPSLVMGLQIQKSIVSLFFSPRRLLFCWWCFRSFSKCTTLEDVLSIHSIISKPSNFLNKARGRFCFQVDHIFVFRDSISFPVFIWWFVSLEGRWIGWRVWREQRNPLHENQWKKQLKICKKRLRWTRKA